jgi:hypothetical protein
LHFDSRQLVFVAILLGGCSQEEAPQPTSAPQAPPSTCGDAGFLATHLSGALTADIEWPDSELLCESMPRPDDRGVRMRFSGEVDSERLAIIIAMPALEAGMTGPDIDAVVTVTVEGSGRFFSTPSLGACWADVTRNEARGDGAAGYIVAGRLACVSPLGEFNGDAFVEVADLQFSGIARWEGS